MAEATGQSAPSVKLAMRIQREAGQLTSTGARGRGAPDMTPKDAATVLIAFMAYEVPGLRAADAVESFGPLVSHTGNMKGAAALSLEALRDLRPPFSFLDAVAEVIALYAFDADSDAFRAAETRLRDGSTLPPECHIFLRHDTTDRGAEIWLGERHHSAAAYHFAPPLKTVAEARAEPDPRLDPIITRSAEVREGTIRRIALAFAAEGRE